MGDQLRTELGIDLYWTPKERKFYSEIASRELGSAYFIEGIPRDNPAGRARYLDKKLKVEDFGIVEKRILKIAEEKGRAFALFKLEEIAIKRFC